LSIDCPMIRCPPKRVNSSFPVDANAVTLIFEDDACWIMLYREGNKVIDVIYKDPNRVMDCLEIA